MKEHTRRAIAYIAGRTVTGRDSTSVYDYAVGHHFCFSGEVAVSSVSVYDYDHRCHVAGSGGSLYHYGNGKHVSLEVRGADFSGYDYHTGRHFSGSVSSTSVAIYDHEHGRHFNYSI